MIPSCLIEATIITGRATPGVQPVGTPTAIMATTPIGVTAIMEVINPDTTQTTTFILAPDVMEQPLPATVAQPDLPPEFFLTRPARQPMTR